MAYNVNIEKLKSGSYRIRKMYKGKKYSIVLDHKPTQKEAIQLIMDSIAESPPDDSDVNKCSLEQATLSFIESKSRTLSPSTIKGYHSNIKHIPKYLLDKKISDITFIDVQKAINDIAADNSPKSVKNKASLIRSVMKAYRPGLDLSHLSLPKMPKQELHIPSDDDVSKMLTSLKGTKYEAVFRLEMYGLRRSEVCALTIDDLSDDDIISINKSIVLTKDNKWIVKNTTKTSKSNRFVRISHDLAELIRSQGYVYNGSPETLTGVYNRTEKALGIEHFSQHKLRHYFVSTMIREGVGMDAIQYTGGWETTHTIDRHYKHLIEKAELEKQKEIVNIYSKILP